MKLQYYFLTNEPCPPEASTTSAKCLFFGTIFRIKTKKNLPFDKRKAIKKKVWKKISKPLNFVTHFLPFACNSPFLFCENN